MTRASAGVSAATEANAWRNAEGGWMRRVRWRHARRALWALLDSHVGPGDTVAVVGAGNAHDLPLRRLRRRARRVDLIDIDTRALRGHRRHGGTFHAQDVTGGAADAIVAAAVAGRRVDVAVPPGAIGAGRYDVVVADLVWTQLLYPALCDAGLPGPQIERVLLRDGQALTDAVAARLHASAPKVIHVHDALGWWAGHPQPTRLDALVSLAATDPQAALATVATANKPLGCDPRAASRAAGARLGETEWWAWPFAPGVDFLVCATVAEV